MVRPSSKHDLIEVANKNYQKLCCLLDSMSEDQLSIVFDFSTDLKKKEAHWKRDKNLRDVLTHLYEWHQLLLKWMEKNKKGDKARFLPEPYTWKTYGDMNVEFWKKHQTTSVEASKEMLNESHSAVLKMIEGFSNEELFTKAFYDWTGATSLGSYCVSATSSHYDWAIKKICANMKKIKKF